MSRQRLAWPMLLLDLRPRSSGCEHWMKSIRSVLVGSERLWGQENSDGSNSLEESNTAVLRAAA